MRKAHRTTANARTGIFLLTLATIGSALAASSDASFTPHAQALFVFFVALFAVTGVRLALRDRWRAPGRGEHRLAFTARLVGAAAIVAMPLAAGSFWSEHELTAEKIGREIDRGAAAIGRQAEGMIERGGEPFG